MVGTLNSSESDDDSNNNRNLMDNNGSIFDKPKNFGLDDFGGFDNMNRSKVLPCGHQFHL